MRQIKFVSLVTLAFCGFLACKAKIPEGVFRCETESECPSGWHCRNGSCWSLPVEGNGQPDGADAETLPHRDSGGQMSSSDGGDATSPAPDGGDTDAAQADAWGDAQAPAREDSGGQMPSSDGGDATAPSPDASGTDAAVDAMASDDGTADQDGGDSGCQASTYYRDGDNDTFGDADASSDACEQPQGYVSDNTDCDDGCADCYPGATEVCDGTDNDCDGYSDGEQFEENDTPETAAALTQGNHVGIRSCPGDEDHFAIDLEVGDVIEVTLTYDPNEGEPDLELNEPGAVMCSSVTIDATTKSVSCTITESQTYYLRTWLLSDTGDLAGTQYNLQISICHADAFEPNDDQAGSALLAPGSYPDLTLCPNNDDYFAIELRPGEHLRVDAAFSHAAGDIDLTLERGGGGTVASSLTRTDNESLSFVETDTGDGVYYLHIHFYSATSPPEVGNEYDLMISICADDVMEDNDSEAASRRVGEGTFRNLTACPADDDYYSIYLMAGEQLGVALDYQPNEGNVDLELWEPGGASPVASLTGTTGDEYFDYSVPAGGVGNYIVRTWLAGDSGARDGNVYQMTLDRPTVAPSCAAGDDRFEPNGSMAEAVMIAEGTYPKLLLCTTGASLEDWYRIDLDVGDEISVGLDFVHTEGDIDLQLWDATTATVLYSASTMSDDEALLYRVTTSGEYFIRAWLVSDGGASVGNEYTMDIAVCWNDTYEPNDELAAGGSTQITKSSYSDLVACPLDEDIYSIVGMGGDTLQVQLLFSDAQGNLSLFVWDSDASAILCSSTTSDDNESVSCSLPNDGVYFIEVSLVAGDPSPGNSYDMLVDLQ